MIEQMEKFLIDYLDDLNDETMKEFNWYLSKNKINGSRPIPSSKLENASRRQTVDLMVQTYGESGAAEVMLNVLFRIRQNDLGLTLTEALAKRRKNQEKHEENRRINKDVERPHDEKNLSCPICLNIFTNPVMLLCGHSFCKACLHRTWEQEAFKSCPCCRASMTYSDSQINFSLKNITDAYNIRKQQPVDVDTVNIVTSVDHEVVKKQRFEGNRNSRAPYPTASKQVKEKRGAFDKYQRSCQSKAEDIQSQSYTIEMEIKEDFEELHTFLKREEEERVAALKEETRKKVRIAELMTQLSRDMLSHSDTVKEMEDLGADEHVMQTFRTNLERTQRSLPDPQQLAQLDRSQHLEDLQLRVGEKMLSDIKQSVSGSPSEPSVSNTLPQIQF